MRNPQHTAALPDVQSEQEPSSVFLTQCHRNALDRLSRSFADRRALAIMVGDSESTSRFVIRKFLSRLDEEVAIARITEPCNDAIEFMREIIAAVGFKPKDMRLDDLDSIFSMFLSFQKSHGRRTVICVEHVQENEWWVLDKIRDIVEMERESEFGLLMVLSGRTDLNQLLNSRPLSSISAYATNRISLAPLTLAETREYIGQKVESTGISNIDDAFEFHAVSLIHELCGGIPDAISSLVDRCFYLADEERMDLVSKDLVRSAYESLRDASEPDDAEHDTSTVNVTSILPRVGKLVVQLSGDEVKELTLRKGHLLVGRSKLCDIRLESKIVSRHHALISHTPEGATIIDLGSTNGTLVDGCSIKEHALTPGETINVGDCQIEYVLEDDRPPHFRGAERTSDDIELNA